MAKYDEQREAVGMLYFGGIRGAKEIQERLGEEFGDGVASERTVYRFIQELITRYTPEELALDEPWQLRTVLPEGVSPEDVPIILKCVEDAVFRGFMFANPLVTIRDAQWIATLWRSMSDAEIPIIHLIAKAYGTRSRWAAIEGKPLDTSDLDSFIAFGSWRGEEPIRVHQTAIDLGLVPDLSVERLTRDQFPMDPKSQRLAMELLESWPKESPYFDSIIEIANSVPQDWRRLFHLHMRAWIDSGLDPEAILQSGRRLAKNYIEEEKEDEGKRQEAVQE